MPMELAIGLDDIATEKALSSGWSCVVLPKTEVAKFAAESQKLLPKGMTEFHAKKFSQKKPAHCQAYGDFLALLRKTAETAPGALLASTLNDQTWHADLTSSADRLVTSVFAALKITDQTIAAGAKAAAPALFTLQRLLTSFPVSPAAVHLLEIDRTTTTAHFGAQTVQVNGRALPATRLLATLAESYREHLFPKSPELDRSAITIVDSSTSFLVQAADVLGNFSMNYVIRNLGPTTAGRTKKAEIFESVFHDILAHTEFEKLASLSGPDFELALKQAGALTFKVQHE